MTRLLVHVEGQTEETFVREVLAHHLYSFGYTEVSPRILGNARLRSQRGGITDWQSARQDIMNHLKQDTKCLVTTMVDYYGLPGSGNGAWPGREKARTQPASKKARTVESAIALDISAAMPGYDERRFLPYLMMHEFEALLFSDCVRFAQSISAPQLSAKLQAVRDEFASPEEINDDPATAPSKRVAAIVTGYQKPLFGTIAVIEIGLDRIRAECPHFNEWLTKLEAWPSMGEAEPNRR